MKRFYLRNDLMVSKLSMKSLKNVGLSVYFLLLSLNVFQSSRKYLPIYSMTNLFLFKYNY